MVLFLIIGVILALILLFFIVIPAIKWSVMILTLVMVYKLFPKKEDTSNFHLALYLIVAFIIVIFTGRTLNFFSISDVPSGVQPFVEGIGLSPINAVLLLIIGIQTIVIYKMSKR